MLVLILVADDLQCRVYDYLIGLHPVVRGYAGMDGQEYGCPGVAVFLECPRGDWLVLFVVFVVGNVETDTIVFAEVVPATCVEFVSL